LRLGKSAGDYDAQDVSREEVLGAITGATGNGAGGGR
jgi:hypothetical protein